MLVLPKQKVVIVKPTDDIATVIPTAIPFEYNGAHLYAIPHRDDESKILRNLGYNVPSPINYYYHWPGQFKPFEHQKKTAEFLCSNMRGIVLNEIGTGKTMSALWASDYLLEQGAVKSVLIISPLSTLERVWGDAIFMNFITRRFRVLHGTRDKRLRELAKPADYYIINHDGVSTLQNELKNKKFDLIIYDEASTLRNISTERFKVFRQIVRSNPAGRLWLMTGTPVPNEPTDAWALAHLISSPNLTQSYTAFRETVMMKLGMYTWVPRPESVDIVKHVLTPAIRFTRDECFDLPETIVQTRQATMTPEQKKAYDKMLKTFMVEVQAESVTAVNEAVKIQKLNQIACGILYTDNGSTVELDCKPRLSLVSDIVEEAGEKVIIFCPFTAALHMLVNELSKKWSVASVYGETSAAQRNLIFSNFQKEKDPHILIAHPKTMAHGLTLTEASTIIWYGPTTSNDQYVQACGRIERIGKRKVSNVIHIESTELERRNYLRLQNKQKLQGLLLELFDQKEHAHV